jgi:hypothetical protein
MPPGTCHVAAAAPRHRPLAFGFAFARRRTSSFAIGATLDASAAMNRYKDGTATGSADRLRRCRFCAIKGRVLGVPDEHLLNFRLMRAVPPVRARDPIAGLRHASAPSPL